MLRNILMTKGLVLGVILLFIGVGIQPAFAISTNILQEDEVESSINTDISGIEEDCNCEVVDNEYLVYVEQKLHKMGLMVRFFSNRYGDIPEVKEKCNKILELLDSDRPLCILLYYLVWIVFLISIHYLNKASDAIQAGKNFLVLVYGSFFLVFYGMALSLSKIYADVLHCKDVVFQIHSYLPLKIYRLKS